MNRLPCEMPQNNEAQFSSLYLPCSAHGKWDERFFFVFSSQQIAFLPLSFPIFHITNCTNTSICFLQHTDRMWQTLCNDNDNAKVKSCMVRGFRDFTMNLVDFSIFKVFLNSTFSWKIFNKKLWMVLRLQTAVFHWLT